MSGPFRLICALLTLLLALPAMQANACAPAPVAPHGMQAHGEHHAHHGDQPKAPQSGTKKHDCVGCIPPIDVAAYRPAREPDIAFALIVNAPEIRFDTPLRAPPEPPPPRMTV